MPTLNVFCEGDHCWPDLLDYPGLIALMNRDAPPIGMALLPGGMRSGQPSVCFRIELPDGRVVVTETSLKLLDHALAIFHGYLDGKAERG